MNKGHELKGELDGSGLQICIVVARWNNFITDRLLEGALSALGECGVADSDIKVAQVPGSFEVPLGAAWAARSGKFDAVIALGAVIRGETAHFEYVAGGAAGGIQQISLETNVPISFGVLTVETKEQALARVGGSEGHKGDEAARAAIEMAYLREKFADDAVGGLASE
ncbi:MAG TPA: 6,7-dimethyl-8-ribityllumazine synthase [Dehalococcoidia bacterium]|jgi:6,7-dimethyl-8-ribityllumazine synthase|nr:6,7-dimethyl-8-ribityllumazine synthase [Dehalococcoidia bacterium]